MSADIRLIVLDIDGVIIGGKQGHNFPLPSPSVAERLHAIDASGVPVVLCTTRATESIDHIVAAIQLRSPQIVHGGAVIIDPVSKQVLHQHTMDRQESERAIGLLQQHGCPVQLYSYDHCFNQDGEAMVEGMRLHDEYLELSPRVVSDVSQIVQSTDLVRINTVVRGEDEKKALTRQWEALKSPLEFHWVTVEHLLPWEYAVITPSRVSKRQGFLEAAKLLGIDPRYALGVGDWIVDWEFMEECGYVGAMGNASGELKEKVRTKEPSHFIIGGHVDEDGLIQILEQFEL
jgi:hydroxymethylpyrimidine pyrophosphatase-like HAD family hydrolase